MVSVLEKVRNIPVPYIPVTRKLQPLIKLSLMALILYHDTTKHPQSSFNPIIPTKPFHYTP